MDEVNRQVKDAEDGVKDLDDWGDEDELEGTFFERHPGARDVTIFAIGIAIGCLAAGIAVMM